MSIQNLKTDWHFTSAVLYLVSMLVYLCWDAVSLFNYYVQRCLFQTWISAAWESQVRHLLSFLLHLSVSVPSVVNGVIEAGSLKSWWIGGMLVHPTPSACRENLLTAAQRRSEKAGRWREHRGVSVLHSNKQWERKSVTHKKRKKKKEKHIPVIFPASPSFITGWRSASVSAFMCPSFLPSPLSSACICMHSFLPCFLFASPLAYKPHSCLPHSLMYRTESIKLSARKSPL